MEFTRGDSGQRQLILGPVEMWIVGGIAAFVSFILLSAYNRVGDLAEGQIHTTGQIAQLSTQISQLSTQLAAVPGLTERVIKLEAKVDEAEEKLREMKDMRGLK